MRQVGQTLGTAILGAILISTLTSNIAKGIERSQVIPASIRQTIADKVSSQASEVEFSGGAQLPAGVSPQIGSEISAIAKQATTDANKVTLLYGALFSFLGLIIASFLKTKKEDEVGVSAAPSKDPAVVPFKHAVAAGSFAIVVIGLLAGLLGYYTGKDKTQVIEKVVSIPVPGPVLNLPLQTVPRKTPETATATTLPTPDTTPGTTPTPPATSKPSTPAASNRPLNTNTPQVYEDANLHIRFTAPAGWRMGIVDANQNSRVFYNPTTGAVYGQIDHYMLPSATDITTVEQQLAQSPDVLTIENTTISGLPAIAFRLTDDNQLVLAAIKNGTLYYISGQLTTTDIQRTFRIE
jgi:hypothetical protein